MGEFQFSGKRQNTTKLKSPCNFSLSVPYNPNQDLAKTAVINIVALAL
jgi:hypothetical protein